MIFRFVFGWVTPLPAGIRAFGFSGSLGSDGSAGNQGGNIVRLGIALAALALLIAALILFQTQQPAPQTHTAVAGRDLYARHCASCHGANLEGEANWQQRNSAGFLPAPPHDASGHTWHHSDQQLLRLVRDGLGSISPGYQTTMPAFGSVLTDQEILSILEYFKSVWPEREREFQASRTRAELAASAQ